MPGFNFSQTYPYGNGGQGTGQMNNSQIPQYPSYTGIPGGDAFNQGNYDQQVRDYINQTLGQYQGLQPYAGTSADMQGPGRATQQSALGAFGGLTANGWDAQSREMQRQAMNKANDATQGNQGALLQQAQMGGMRTGSGSSAGLAAQAAGQQGGANAQAVAQRSAQSAALGRRLQALGAYGSLAGTMRGQDLGNTEQGYQNALAQISGLSNTRNSLANYYTNQLNASSAANGQNVQAALGAAGLGLGAYGAYNNMSQQQPYSVGLSTDYGAGSLVPSSQYGGAQLPDYWNLPGVNP